MEGRGGQPEGYCHRQLLDAVRYLVDNGIKWRAMPADFPAWDRVYAFCRRWRAGPADGVPRPTARPGPRGRRPRSGADRRGDRRAVPARRGHGAGVLTWVRRREKGPRTQTPHRGRLPRPAAGRAGHRR
ncbi:transposase [Streptomyces klenkii]